MKNILIILIAVLAFNSYPRSLKGVEFDDEMTLAGKKLVLNGLGLRKKVILFTFKVYVAGLYLEKKSSNPEQILNSKQIKRLEMKFMRDVDGEKISEAYIEGLKNNGVDVSKFPTEVKLLTSKITDIEKGERITFDFLEDKIDITHGKVNFQITNKKFMPHVLKLWLGVAPNPDLKNGILGL